MTNDVYFTFDELLDKWNANEEQILEFISSGQLHPTYIVNDIDSIKAYFVDFNGDIKGEIEVTPFDINYDLLIDDDGLGRHVLVDPKFKTSKLFYFEHSRQMMKSNKGKNVYFKHFENTQGSIKSKIFDLNFIKNNTEFAAKHVAECEEKNTITVKKKTESSTSQQQRKINNLLRIIYALANNSIKGFDGGKAHASAVLISVALDIEDAVCLDTLTKYINEAHQIELNKKSSNPN
jgi:hypothetical protein